MALVTLLAWCLPSHATDDPWSPFEIPWFESIGVASGLPHSVATSVVQDSRGLIWAGTMGGLVRYDGLHMQIFDARSSGPASLPDSYVRCLLVLADDELIIGTNAGGLVRFNPQDNSFSTWPTGMGGTGSSKIYALASDHAGGAWIAHAAGLDHLDAASGDISIADPTGAVAGTNYSVYQDHEGNVWVGNEKGLMVRYHGSTEFVRVHLTNPAITVVTDDLVWAIHGDDDGRVWFGGVASGAVYRDATGNWHGVPGYFSRNRARQWPTVRAITHTADGAIWIATDGYGVIHYLPGATGSHIIRHDASVPSSLPGDAVRALFPDRSGNIWMATNRGLATTRLRQEVASAILPSTDRPTALSGNSVHAILIDSRGLIWLGLNNGRIDVIDRTAGTMQHLQLGNRNAHRDVMAFVEMDDGSLRVGSEGVSRIDPTTMEITKLQLGAIDDKPVLALAHDGDRLLIGTYEGLFRHNPATRTLDWIRHDPGDPGSLTNNTIRTIARVADRWWYGTARGISIADSSSDNKGFHNLIYSTDSLSGLPQDYTRGIREDGNGRVWISTFGGLIGTEPTESGLPSRERKVVTTSDGLSSNKVDSTLADKDGRIWLSVSNGINVLDPGTGMVRALGQRDGMAPGSYVSIAAARTTDDTLLFGGLDGLTVIRPWLAGDDGDDAPLVVTQAALGDKDLPYAALPDDGGHIRLAPHTRSMRIDFGLLDYHDTRGTRYSYRMDGLEQGWTSITPGNIPSAVYTTLPHGSYTLIMRADTQGLHPRRIESRVRVTVMPLWYETLYARLAALALLAALVMALVHLRTWMLQQRARQLQQRIDASTRELREANARLDHLAATDGLTGVYNRRRFLELVEEWRQQVPPRLACLALLDLDHFKQINDTYGHLAGDEVLRSSSTVIRAHCRRSDLIGRFGGEELMIFMPDTQIGDARTTVERIREALADHPFQHEGRSIRATVSIGVTAAEPGETIESWLARTDAMLYKAKNMGRNKTVIDD